MIDTILFPEYSSFSSNPQVQKTLCDEGWIGMYHNLRPFSYHTCHSWAENVKKPTTIGNAKDSVDGSMFWMYGGRKVAYWVMFSDMTNTANINDGRSWYHDCILAEAKWGSGCHCHGHGHVLYPLTRPRIWTEVVSYVHPREFFFCVSRRVSLLI